MHRRLSRLEKVAVSEEIGDLTIADPTLEIYKG